MKFLEKLNLCLLEYEEKQRGRGYRMPSQHPTYFVIGAPRAGTTLLTQALAYCYDYGYITNIAARFWMCPTIGIKLSQEILGDGAHPSFESNIGRSSDPSDIHAFGKFWMSHLGFDNSKDVSRPVDGTSYAMIQRSLFSIQDHFDKPLVMKGVYPAYVKEMIETMGVNPVWANIERDPLDCCVSIMLVREVRGTNKWFGWYLPKEHQKWVGELSVQEQIAAQVAYFRAFYRKIATHTITLADLTSRSSRSLEILKDITGMEPYFHGRVTLNLQLREYDDALCARWGDLYNKYESMFEGEFSE